MATAGFEICLVGLQNMSSFHYTQLPINYVSVLIISEHIPVFWEILAFMLLFLGGIFSSPSLPAWYSFENSKANPLTLDRITTYYSLDALISIGCGSGFQNFPINHSILAHTSCLNWLDRLFPAGFLLQHFPYGPWFLTYLTCFL